MKSEVKNQPELSAATDVATEKCSPQGLNLSPCAERGQRERSTVKEGAVDSSLHPAHPQTHTQHREHNTRHVTGSCETHPLFPSPSHSCIMSTSTTVASAPSLLPLTQRHDDGCDNDNGNGNDNNNNNNNHSDRNRQLQGSSPVPHRRGLSALDSLNLEQSQIGSHIPNDGRNHDGRRSLPIDHDHNRPAADELRAIHSEARASVEDCTNQSSFDTKKKTLSTSSISSTSSATSASSESTATSASLPSSPSPPSPPHMPSFPKEKSLNLATPASITLATLQQHHYQAPSPEPSQPLQVGLDTPQSDSTLDLEPQIETGVQEDIKEVEIETEDPSHLFWVPFHMHPEIAPNEYNKWLSRHGVDSTGTGAANVLSHRNSAVNRRKSVLSAQYNPEDDDEEEEQAERKKSRRRAVVVGIAEQEEERPRDDFLSGVFSAPLEQMGEPPLKTKTSLRRSTSHTTSALLAHKDAVDSNAEDTTVRRAGATGLSRNGPSLMRRSARTKIRRDSTASTDVRHDPSRLRRTVDENGDYAAVTLVDPGPLPLSPSSPPSTLVQLADSIAPWKEEDGKAQETEKPPSKPLKRFVSTLRDSSKPTITTYIEPQLLEQQRKDLEEEADGLSGTPARPSLSNGSAAGAGGPKASYEAVPVSKVTFPIPPPVKLSQNLLQQPAARPVSAKPTSKQHQQHQQNSTQKHSVPLLSVPPHSKKSSSWSWLWGKEKGGAGGGGDADPQRSHLTPGMPLSRQQPLLTPSENNGKKTAPSGEATTVITVKKQSTLSLLFSRNGKASQAKAQQQSASETKSYNNNGNNNRHSGPSSGYQYCHDGDCEPGRMPLQIERAVYRLSHAKLANPRRPLHQQVLISNMMFWYLGIAQQEQQQQMQQQQQQQQQRQQPQQQQPQQPPQQQQQQQQQPQQLQLQQQQRPQEKTVSNGRSNTFGEMDADSIAQQQQQQQQQQQASRRSNVLHDDKTSNVVGVATEIRDDDGFVHQVVPQQDSNSHARSPSPGLDSKRMRGSTSTTTTTTTSNHSPSKRDAVYDEESMIGGGYNGDNILGWSDEEEEDDEEDEEEEVEVEEIEYQEATNGFATLHALPSGPSSTSSPLPVQPLAYSY